MTSKILSNAYFALFVTFSHSQSIFQTYEGSCASNIPLPHPLYLPINLNVSSARPAPVSPIVDTIFQSVPNFIENIGQRAVQVRPVGEVNLFITGGVLLNDRYHFEFQSFNWNGFPTTFANIETNGTPLQTQMYFYNLKYGSFVNAFNYVDGLAVILINVSVSGKIPDSTFAPLEMALNCLRIPGSRAHVSDTIAQIFYNTLNQARFYNSYHGTYVDLITRRQYPCATIIQIPDVYSPSISIPQFSAFTSVLNTFGRPTTSILYWNAQGELPVTEARTSHILLLRPDK